MCAAIDNKPTGIQKILNIFSRSKQSSLGHKSSNHNGIDNLRTDAIAITHSNRISSLQMQPGQTQRNESFPVDLMSPPNLALHSQHFFNGGGGNVNNNFHISGSEAVHIGNQIQIIQNSSKQVTNNTPEKVSRPDLSIRNGTNNEKSKRFSNEQKRIINKLKKSTTEITEEIINMASNSISPKNANFIYRYLGLSDATIDIIEKDNFVLHGSKEVTYKMLLHWKQSADEPTIGQLIKALYENKNDQCINELIKHFTEDGLLSEYIKDQ